MTERRELFGSLQPFAEPAWYHATSSPHYGASHRRLRQFVRSYVDTHLPPDQCAEWEESGRVPGEVRRRHVVEHGFLLPSIPSRYRAGRPLPAGIPEEEWDGFHSLILVDELARIGVLGVIWGLSGGTSIGLPPLLKFGSHAQVERFLPSVLDGSTVFCLGITEPDAGSDVSGIRTVAERTPCGRQYRVNGTKKWITNGMWADYCMAAVRTTADKGDGAPGSGAKGISLLIVPLKSAGVSRIPIKNSGVNASGSAYLHFEDTLVPIENLIGRENEGFAMIMANFNNERLSLSISSIRLARICVQDAFDHAMQRKTFGKVLLENQVIRAKFGEMGRMIETAWSFIESLVYHSIHCREEEAGRDLAGLLALAKIQGSRTLEYCNRECQQIFGGLGYQRSGRGSRVEQISRDLRVQAVGGGSDEIMVDLAVKTVIGNYARKVRERAKNAAAQESKL